MRFIIYLLHLVFDQLPKLNQPYFNHGFLNNMKIKVLLIVLVGISCEVFAVQVPKDSIASDTTIFLNQEVVVTADRQETVSFDGAHAVAVLNKRSLQLMAPMSMPDALASVSGVWMQKTNHGGGSPFIRGLTGYQTLLLIDGIRFNNTTFRSGPNQYLNTIDPLMTDRIEVVRGQGSVQYGSDAIGGVIQMMSHDPIFSSNGVSWNGYVYGKYLSDNMEQTGRLSLDVGMENTAISAGLTSKNFGDIVAGGELGVLESTGYDEYSLDFKLLQRIKERHLFTVAYQRHSQNDVPLYHKLGSGGYSDYKFDPQQRELGYLKWEFFTSKKWLKQIKVIQSFQNSIEGRVKQKTGETTIKNERDEVNSFGTVLEVISKPTDFWTVSSGLEYYYDKVRSSAFEEQDNSPGRTDLRGLYPDNSNSGNMALYSLHSFVHERFNFSLGGRYNKVRLTVDDDLFGSTAINPNAIVGNAGITFKASTKHHIIGSINSAFRAPNVNDVSSLGVADFRYEIPNYELKPEKSLNLEVGLKSKYERFSSNIYFYQNKLTNLITNVRSTFNGQNSVDGVQVYQRTNIGETVLRGVETDIEYLIKPSILAQANLTYTYGQNYSKDEPMRRIPPLYGGIGLFWHLGTKTKLSGKWSYAGKQDRLSNGDIDDGRIADGGTPAWNTLDFSFHYLLQNVQLQAGVKNLLDEAYRTHGSGVDGIGRSFWLSAKLIL